MVTGVAAVLALGLVTAGCNFSKTGAVAPNAPDMVTVLPSVGGQNTSVTLDLATVSALTSLGVSVLPTGRATQQGSIVSFPITSGYAEVHSRRDAKPGWIDGSLAHEGSGLDLMGVTATVHLDDFVVDPGNSMLYATVNGKIGVPVLELDGTKVTETVNDVGQVVLAGTVAKLTQTAAGALNQAFATSMITAGMPLGQVEVVASGSASAYNAAKDHVTAISSLRGTSTTLTVEPAVASTLASAGLGLTPTGSATAAAPGAISFPITSGFAAVHQDRSFSPGSVVGTIDHQGSGITIGSSAPGGSAPPLTLSNFVVDPGDSVLTGTVNGKVGVPLFFLDGAKLQVTPTSGGVTVDGTVAQLTTGAATALDQAFGTEAFTAGLAIGTVHLVATGS
ncbi:MAG: hypothetical protein M3Y91_12225 [Actinomycetota bacterium]|nr:hypothetical protein [Actinomycetota bacterium]